MKNNDGRGLQNIESEIEQTRSDIDTIINTIQARLSPNRMMDQAMSYVRNGGASEFAENLGKTVKQNPVPVTLLGMSLAWLMMSGSKDKNSDKTSDQINWMGCSDDEYQPYTSYRNGGGRDVGIYENAGSRLSDPAQFADGFDENGIESGISCTVSENSRDKMNTIKNTAREFADTTRSKAGDLLNDVRNKAGDLMQGTREKMSDMKIDAQNTYGNASYRTRQAVRQTGNQFSHVMQEQPLLLGALGMAIGAVLGAGLPRT